MPCEVTTLPNRGRAIVCGSRRRQRCACGNLSTRLCDWKVPGRRSGTCDKPLCRQCTHEPAPDKDLCPNHAAEWKAMQEGAR